MCPAHWRRLAVPRVEVPAASRGGSPLRAAQQCVADAGAFLLMWTLVLCPPRGLGMAGAAQRVGQTLGIVYVGSIPSKARRAPLCCARRHCRRRLQAACAMELAKGPRLPPPCAVSRCWLGMVLPPYRVAFVEPVVRTQRVGARECAVKINLCVLLHVEHVASGASSEADLS